MVEDNKNKMDNKEKVGTGVEDAREARWIEGKREREEEDKEGEEEGGGAVTWEGGLAGWGRWAAL